MYRSIYSLNLHSSLFQVSNHHLLLSTKMSHNLYNSSSFSSSFFLFFNHTANGLAKISVTLAHASLSIFSVDIASFLSFFDTDVHISPWEGSASTQRFNTSCEETGPERKHTHTRARTYTHTHTHTHTHAHTHTHQVCTAAFSFLFSWSCSLCSWRPGLTETSDTWHLQRTGTHPMRHCVR